MIASLVYFLSALMCALCAGLLLRSYARNGNRLLLWSGLSFCCFTVTNVLVILDVVFLPDVDLSLYRDLTTVVGACVLLFGLIWES